LAGAKNSFHPLGTLTFVVLSLFLGCLALLLVAQYIEYTHPLKTTAGWLAIFVSP
jgi:hypothetical protein